MTTWLHPDWINKVAFIRITNDHITKDFPKIISLAWFYQDDCIKMTVSVWLQQHDFIRMNFSGWFQQNDFIRMSASRWPINMSDLLTKIYLYYVQSIRKQLFIMCLIWNSLKLDENILICILMESSFWIHSQLAEWTRPMVQLCQALSIK